MAELPQVLVASLQRCMGFSTMSAKPVSGGCIANATRLETDKGVFFLKWAGPGAGDTFVAEGEGLVALADAGSSLVIPRPLCMSDAAVAGTGFLLIPWLDQVVAGPGFWERLGEGLAELHRANSGSDYGFEKDNFIGRIEQANETCENWAEFFSRQRIQPQVDLARHSGRWKTTWDRALDTLLSILSSLLPASPHVSLVHGDLWSGNVLPISDGHAAIIDPAVYRGHREVDLAMTELFGGFRQGFYDAYNATWRLDDGYRERRDIYNLYHLINHLNHFGGAYSGQVETILRRF